ncbi:MAG: class I SAM-dependent RNA methyltransferase, partial [Oscillospiraceae bacterium]|nr:class I SAM-dependent RNA methyltransferase [Oscillospiraceae bacterium]
AAIEDAKENARRNGIENADFICADASDAARHFADIGMTPDVIIVDPPRKGLAPDVIDSVVQMSPDRVVYVSCDPATLARDLKLFTEKGYKAVKLTAADMFPRTRHVESVALLIRSK